MAYGILVDAAARERDIAMEQEEPPQVIGQLEQSLAQRLTPGVEQMVQQQPQQQPQQQQQPPMQQGISGVPAPNMMMSGGGIVSFADGGRTGREVFYGPPGSGQVFYGPPVEPQLSPSGRRGVVTAENITDQSFEDAFKWARANGLDTFNWRGKEYHTKYPEEM